MLPCCALCGGAGDTALEAISESCNDLSENTVVTYDANKESVEEEEDVSKSRNDYGKETHTPPVEVDGGSTSRDIKAHLSQGRDVMFVALSGDGGYAKNKSSAKQSKGVYASRKRECSQSLLRSQ